MGAWARRETEALAWNHASWLRWSRSAVAGTYDLEAGCSCPAESRARRPDCGQRDFWGMDAWRIRWPPSLMSAWILKRRTVTLKHLQIFAGRWWRSSSTSAKPVAWCMHFRNGLIVVTRTLLLTWKFHQKWTTRLCYSCFWCLWYMWTCGCKCLTWSCVLMLRRGEVACTTAQDCPRMWSWMCHDGGSMVETVSARLGRAHCVIYILHCCCWRREASTIAQSAMSLVLSSLPTQDLVLISLKTHNWQLVVQILCTFRQRR